MQVIYLQKTTGEAVPFGRNMKKQPGKTHTGAHPTDTCHTKNEKEERLIYLQSDLAV